MIDKLFKSKETTGLFAFIIGFGLVVIVLRGPLTIERVLALEPIKFEGKEVKSDGKCYKYRVEDASCELTPTK